MRRLSLPIAVIALAALAAPVAALSPDREFGGAIDDFQLDGVCAFPVWVHVVDNREYVTTFYDRYGQPTVVRWTGRLTVTLTNLDSGHSIDVNASGPGVNDLRTGASSSQGLLVTWQDTVGSLVQERGRHDPTTGEGVGLTVSLCDLLDG